MAESEKRKSLWEYLALYPAIVLAIGGALGSGIPAAWQEWKAYKLGVKTNQVQMAEEQQHLWEKNLECLRVKPVYTIRLEEGIEVGVTLCGSGDALLRYGYTPENVSYIWVKYPGVKKLWDFNEGQSFEFVHPMTRIVLGVTRCLFMQARIVSWAIYNETNHGLCTMEQISAIKGKLLRRYVASCDVCE